MTVGAVVTVARLIKRSVLVILGASDLISQGFTFSSSQQCRIATFFVGVSHCERETALEDSHGSLAA